MRIKSSNNDDLTCMPRAMMMIDFDGLSDWITRGLLIVTIIFLALVAVGVLIIAVCEVICAFRRRSSDGAKTGPEPMLSIEELLERIPDVTYLQTDLLPVSVGAGGAAADDDDDDRESCVICVAPYEHGDACGILPGCRHMFHKLCVAKWLRQNTTCPLCRAAFAVTDDTQQSNVNAVDNIV